MKKVLISLLIILICCPIFFINSKRNTHAISGTVYAQKVESDDAYIGSCDISFINDNIVFLNKGSVNPPLNPQILTFDGQAISLETESNFLCCFDNKYFYATDTEVYYYDPVIDVPETEKHIQIDKQFNRIVELAVSAKNLFLIDSIAGGNPITHIYKYNTENSDFEIFKSYNTEIEKFAYSEVSKNIFIYDGEKVMIDGIDNAEDIIISDIAKMLCDFEGNLYLFKTSSTGDESVYRYSYESTYSEFADYNLDFNFDLPDTYIYNHIISAAFNQNTGEFALLCGYVHESSNIYNIYKISKDSPLTARTSLDPLDIPEFKNLKLTELPALDFYAAEISGYPSNRLYPADITIGGEIINDGEILEILAGEKVLVFKTSENEKFAYVLYKNKFAAIYNNSLKLIHETVPAYQAKVILNRSKIYSCPSIFKYGENSEHSFTTGEIEKSTVINVLGEIELYGVTFCYIEYGDNKSGYINKAEISDHDKIVPIDPKFGKIDCNGKIPLYKDKSTSSEHLTMLSNKQKIKIIESGNDFCYIEVEISGEVGYVETQYVLEDGLTKFQKMGLWLFLSALLLAVVAILLRVFFVKRRKKKT